MKVAYIGSFTRIYDEEGIARSLEKLGVLVDRYEESAFEVETTQKIIDSKPDLVLFAKLKILPYLRLGFVRKMKEVGIKTVCWVPDLYFGLAREHLVSLKDAIFEADLVCTPDGWNDSRFQKHGVNHRLLRQGIYDEEIKPGKYTQRPYEIVFVGTENAEFPYRTSLMNFLTKTYGDKFKWFGRNNPREIREEELTDLYTSVPIVIGDSVYAPHYWSNRIYETLGRGGFLIHPQIPGLAGEFGLYKDFIPYRYHDFDGLREIINFYLENTAERSLIRQHGQETVKNNFTLVHRCQELLKFV